jgi:hypothetical protein
MSLVAKFSPFALVAATLLAACSDISSPTQSISAPASASASKGGTGGGGGGGGGSAGAPQLVVTTPPTVNATGTWIGTTDGPDIIHTYTFTLTQTAAGTVSGVSAMRTAFTNGFALVVGTVNGDTLTLYAGPGTVCSSCQLSPYYSGIISAVGSRLDGSFFSGGSPLTLLKQ